VGGWVVFRFGNIGNKGTTEKLLEKQLGKVDLKKFEHSSVVSMCNKGYLCIFYRHPVAPETAKKPPTHSRTSSLAGQLVRVVLARLKIYFGHLA